MSYLSDMMQPSIWVALTRRSGNLNPGPPGTKQPLYHLSYHPLTTENGLRHASGPIHANLPSVTFIKVMVTTVFKVFFFYFKICPYIKFQHQNSYPMYLSLNTSRVEKNEQGRLSNQNKIKI